MLRNSTDANQPDEAQIEKAIVRAVLDYFEGWFDGDAVRMKRALHPGLAKRTLEEDGTTLDDTTAAWMIEATAQGVGRERGTGDRGIQVTVDDIHRTIATATVHSTVYREYLHLVHTAEGWKIVNTLWEPTE